MSYSTLAELKVWIAGGGDIDTVDDSALQVILDACTRVIDRKCGRSFVLEDEVTKYFYPTSQGSLDVIDLISITSLASDSHGDRTYTQTFASTDYELLPYTDPSGRPATRYQQIRIWPNSSNTFGPGRLVKVVGDWGYLEAGNLVPPDVKQACLLLASREWKRREMPTGSLAIPDIGTVERVPRTDPDVEMLLDPYMRTNSWVAV